jgi:hypothetical protein
VRLALLLVAMFLAPAAASGQVTTGLPPFGSFSGGPADTVNNANLNVHLPIPVLNKAGRGMALTYSLAYDSSVWYPTGASGSRVWRPVLNWGWTAQTQPVTGYASYNYTLGTCSEAHGAVYSTYSNWVYVDAFGAPHGYGSLQVSNASHYGCGGPPASGSARAADGSGYLLGVQAGNLDGVVSASVTSPGGVQFSPPLLSNSGSGTVADTNGNQTSVSSGAVVTDTLGTSAVSISGLGTPSSPVTYAYTAASGNQARVTVNFARCTVQTNFGCSGITEYGATAQNLVSSVTLPDNTSYSFTYEITPGDTHNPHHVTGRLASVTLPTGGTISYSYSGGSNGITCADGSAATLTRTTQDGAWTYAHSERGTAWTTTLTDPQSDVATFNFQGIYETERQVASLETIYTCYNGASFPCNTTSMSLPITRRTVTTSIGGLESQVNTDYNSYGLVTEVDEYGYGRGAVGSLVR